MKNCSNCKNHTWGDEWWNCTPECNRCRYTKQQGEDVPSNWKPMPMTNADRIRAMTDEELADWHASCPYIDKECTMKGCVKCVLEWLQQPEEGDA